MSTVADVQAGLASERFLASIPREFSRAHLILSQGAIEGGEKVLVAASTSTSSIWNAGVRLGVPVTTEIADAETLARAIDEAYAARAPPKPTADLSSTLSSSGGQTLEELIREADQDLLQTQGKSRVVQLVDALLFEAVGRKASDVHVQPTDVATLVRYRVDGALATVRELPKSLAAPLLGRVKVMGRMDVAERRVPQDGRATVTIGDRAIDLRIGVFPTSYGERAVLRILDPTRRVDDLESLGMPPDVRDRFLACTGRADGFVLVTGPTGAGKTTTLYAALKKIASPDLNVMTIEDPIEYDLAKAASSLPVSQSQVNLKKGVSFATGLRHLLRQDPDVILVGEIRDAETARMAIQSSLTGHLVLSTLHTNDAPSAVTRLVDLGVEPFLVSASLAAVLAQRLVRTLHRPCGGRGCTDCLSTGFLGRRGLYELMVIDEHAQRLIARGADLNDLRAAARASGMRTLREEGERLIAAGETTPIEVERVVQGAVT
jgi:general secretion pathway protein E